MAAKVVMVAVPTVLGLASIRVYRVSEVPADGLIGREKLNIYTPLPSSAQVQFVPEKQGVIESGLAAVRESLLPAVQTVQGACVSVKTGSVNIYHAGEDVYYYLKDPPPGFLPRLGTIAMAGLLGMFLARKGSRVKRFALPLGLMTAGVSVCYPAHAVATLKVTGQKLYAAGRWSSAAVSSLLASRPKEDVAKGLAASQPQGAPVPNPEPAASEEAHPAACHVAEPNPPADAPARPAEGEPAGSDPGPDEPIVAVTTEPSSITHAEVSSHQNPTETTKDTAVSSVPAEAGPPSEELPGDVSAEASLDVTESSSEPEPGPAETADPPRPSEETPAPEPSDPAAAETLGHSVESGPPAEESPDVPPAEESPDVPPVEESPDVPPVEESPEVPPVEESPEVPPAEESPEVPPAEEPTTPAHTPPPSENTTETIGQSVESGPPAEEEPATVTHTPPPPPENTTETVIEPVESGPPAEVTADNPPAAAAAEEPPTPTHTPPPPEAASSGTEGGSGLKTDPALMDFGQSSPEDADLYTTRS